MRIKLHEHSTFFSRSNLRRAIHNPIFIPKGVDEMCMIGNNSMLFATHQALQIHGIKAFPKMHFICTDFWLDHVDMKKHGQLDWGQTLLGFPKIARDLFIKMRPNYPLDKFVTWQDYQDLRTEAMDILAKTQGVLFYKSNPKSIQLEQNNFIIALTQNSVSLSKNAFFYFWYRQPKKIEEVTNNQISIYSSSFTADSDTIIVIGHGLSVVWLLKHFPNMKIISIKRPLDTLPEVPSNSDLNIQREINNGRFIVYDYDKVELRTDAKKETAMIRDRKTMAILHKNKKVFSAAGLVPDHEICRAVPGVNKIIMPLFDEYGRLISPNDEHTIRLIQDLFIAPKNLPLGSLAHSFTYLMEITRNINWTADPMTYFSNSNYERLRDHLKKYGISLDVKFYNTLDKFIESEDNPKSFQDSINYYLAVYETTCHSTTIEKQRLRDALIDYFNINNFSRELPERNTKSFV